MLKAIKLAACFACVWLLLIGTGAADDLYEFDFEHGMYSISMPTSADPKITRYIDTDGGEFSWRIDEGGAVYYLYGMTHTTREGEWRYGFDHCQEVERDPFKTLKVNRIYWKYSVADVVTNKNEAERTYVDLWLTRHALKHDLRFCCDRFENHEQLMKIIKKHMKTIVFWN